MKAMLSQAAECGILHLVPILQGWTSGFSWGSRWFSLLPCSRSSLPPGSVVKPVADKTPSPSRPPPNLAASAKGPETADPEIEETAHREMVIAPLPIPEEGRAEKVLFCLKTSIKERFPQSLGLKRRRVVKRASRDHFPPPLLPGSGWLPKSTPLAHSWKQVRTAALPASSCHTPGCHKPQARFLCFHPLEEESGECYTAHPDPAPCRHRPGRPRSVQSDGRRVVSSGTSWGVATPSTGSPADLESVRSYSGRPVCISGNHTLPVVLLPI